jgi:hypothetical protein
MKRLIVVVPDDFDCGAVISLIGTAASYASITPYVPPERNAPPQVVTPPARTVTPPARLAKALTPPGAELATIQAAMPVEAATPPAEVPKEPEVVVTGRNGKDRHHSPGLSRDYPKNRIHKVGGVSMRDRVSDLLTERNDWVGTAEVEAMLVDLGYKEGGASKILSILKCDEEVEVRNYKTKRAEYRRHWKG